MKQLSKNKSILRMFPLNYAATDTVVKNIYLNENAVWKSSYPDSFFVPKKSWCRCLNPK